MFSCCREGYSPVNTDLKQAFLLQNIYEGILFAINCQVQQTKVILRHPPEYAFVNEQKQPCVQTTEASRWTCKCHRPSQTFWSYSHQNQLHWHLQNFDSLLSVSYLSKTCFLLRYLILVNNNSLQSLKKLSLPLITILLLNSEKWVQLAVTILKRSH